MKAVLTAVKLLIVLGITSLAASIWWGATLTANLKNLSARMDEKIRAVDVQLDKMESRFDRLEDKLDKVLNFVKPILKP